MSLLEVLIIFRVSLLGLWCSLLYNSNMKSEFIRFGLSKFGHYGNFRNCGAIGLLVGLLYNSILLISSGGLAY
jgi:hypothetical protein